MVEVQMRVMVFNARFSANVGDGLIAECMQRQLKSTPGVTHVEIVDLSGKKSVSPHRRRRLASRAFLVASKLPRWLGRPLALVMNVYATLKLVPRWNGLLKDADAVIIGGGQLLSDDGYYFPVRLAGVLFLAKRNRLPVALHALGMSPVSWGTRALLRPALHAVDLRDATFRDAASRDRFNQMMQGRQARLAPDPALMTGRLMKPMVAAPGAAALGSASPQVVGLGIIEPRAVNEKLSADPAARPLTDEVFLKVARCLAETYKVHVFCNGLYEDAALLRRLRPALLAAGVHIHDPPSTPADLVTIIAACDCIVAHRLHAVIAAHSLAKPFVALQWCPKVASFCRSVDLEANFLNAADLSGPAVSAAVSRAFACGTDRYALKQQIDLAVQGMEDTVRMLGEEGRAAAGQPQVRLDRPRTQR